MASESAAERLARLPDLRLVAAWLTVAHACLVGAAAIVVADPALLAGAFYHPRLLAAVHLVTVGWITATILAALYLVPGMAMRAPVAPRPADGLAVAAFAVGIAALVRSFWLAERGTTAVAGALLAAAAAWVAARTLPPIWRSPVPLALRLCFPLAFVALAVAVVLGVGIAAWPGTAFAGRAPFAGTFAHAHLAVLGWVLPIVLGSGYRLLPMLLPAAMPAGALVRASVVTAFLAAAALPAGLLLALPWLRALGGSAAVLAVLLFLANVAWMVRHRKRPPPSRPPLDLPLVHVAGALLALLAATACGVALLWAGPLAPPGLRAAYGILALLGCFGQLIAGVEQRLVGWLLWLRAYTGSAYERVPPTPYDLLARPLQAVVAATWLAAVGMLATGAATNGRELVRAGAVAIAVGALGGGALLVSAARRARQGTPGPGAAPPQVPPSRDFAPRRPPG